jgi:hypothetical protein
MEPNWLPVEQFLQAGFSIAGFATISSPLLTNEKCFCANFGARAQAFLAILICPNT